MGSSDEISMAFHDMLSAGAACAVRTDGKIATKMLLEQLLDAATSGDYSFIAADLSEQFWELQRAGAGSAVNEYRKLFVVLIDKCPALREPLQKELDARNPYIDLLPRIAAQENLDADLSTLLAAFEARGWQARSSVVNTDARCDEAPAPTFGNASPIDH